jgi:hypothetical protein
MGSSVSVLRNKSKRSKFFKEETTVYMINIVKSLEPVSLEYQSNLQTHTLWKFLPKMCTKENARETKMINDPKDMAFYLIYNFLEKFGKKETSDVLKKNLYLLYNKL